MIFEENKFIAKTGYIFGFILAYLLFTSILCLMLVLLKKIHGNFIYPLVFTYLPVAGITLSVSLIGLIIRRLLK